MADTYDAEVLDYAASGAPLFVDNAGRARLAFWLLLAVALLTLAHGTMQFVVGRMALADGGVLGDTSVETSTVITPGSEARTTVFRQAPAVSEVLLTIASGVLGLVVFAAWVAAVVYYMMWQHRAFANLRSAGAPVQFGPGWSVGWWFIPLANLVAAGLVVVDLWRNARRAAHGPGAGGFNPGYLLWALFALPYVSGAALGIALVVQFVRAVQAGGGANAGFGNSGFETDLMALILWAGAVNTLISVAFYALMAWFVLRVQAMTAGDSRFR